jgi:hypothetical protein
LDIAVWNRENQAGNSAGGVGVAKQHAAPRLRTHVEGRFRRLEKVGREATFSSPRIANKQPRSGICCFYFLFFEQAQFTSPDGSLNDRYESLLTIAAARPDFRSLKS